MNSLIENANIAQSASATDPKWNDGSQVRVSSRQAAKAGMFLLLTMSGAYPLNAADDARPVTDLPQSQSQKHSFSTVVYSGPLTRDAGWILKAGPPGPGNQRPVDFGGTCSMIPRDVQSASGQERVTFTAEDQGFGLWLMTWRDLVAGKTTSGDSYVYQQTFTYLGTTTDGNPPAPNRDEPNPDIDNTGYSQMVPSNVLADALDVNDIFMIQNPAGQVVANSHFRLQWRLQNSPAAQDPPPAAFPKVLHGKYILTGFTQLSGQAGCDPL